MVQRGVEEELGGAPARSCGQCGHGEDEHEQQEAELPGTTARRTYCLGCAGLSAAPVAAGFHDFVPAPS